MGEEIHFTLLKLKPSTALVRTEQMKIPISFCVPSIFDTYKLTLSSCYAPSQSKLIINMLIQFGMTQL